MLCIVGYFKSTVGAFLLASLRMTQDNWIASFRITYAESMILQKINVYIKYTTSRVKQVNKTLTSSEKFLQVFGEWYQ